MVEDESTQKQTNGISDSVIMNLNNTNAQMSHTGVKVRPTKIKI